jgi:hypothetical protein
MTRTEMHNWFDLIQDKYNAPYFIVEEKDEFLNRAQTSFVNEVYPPSEYSTFSTDLIKTLIIEDLSVSTNGSDFDKITDSDINTALVARTEAGNTYRHIYSIRAAGDVFTAGRPVRFVRHNDRDRIVDNFFKKPKDSDPIYRIVSDGIIVEGETDLSAQEDFLITVIKNPKDISDSQD